MKTSVSIPVRAFHLYGVYIEKDIVAKVFLVFFLLVGLFLEKLYYGLIPNLTHILTLDFRERCGSGQWRCKVANMYFASNLF